MSCTATTEQTNTKKESKTTTTPLLQPTRLSARISNRRHHHYHRIHHNRPLQVASHRNGGGVNSCTVHVPTLDELKSYTFSDFVRKVVIPAASQKYEDDDDDSDSDQQHHNNNDDDEDGVKDDFDYENDETIELIEGIAKVTLPDGFWEEEGIAGDRTARGPAWQQGTPLGDYQIGSPMQQHVRGLAGIYEYTFTDRPSMTIAEYRTKADEYRKKQVGCEIEEGPYTAERLATLERQFWKRLGPTMPPPMYGADQEGSLFGDDPASGWSISGLDTCLHVLSNLPGVTTPYLYVGMWASVFCAHAEDADLLSINYLHAGAPKIWYAVAEVDAARFLSLAAFHFSAQAKECKEFLRHKRCLISPAILKKAGIRYHTVVQNPGEAVITFPGSYHFGFNSGFNVAEATNFAVPEWLSFGRRAKFCMCRPDSVRIDADQLTALLLHFEADKAKNPHLSWRTWGIKYEEKRARQKKEQEKKADAVPVLAIIPATNEVIPLAAPSAHVSGKKSKTKLSDQQKKKEFWIEVMAPMPWDASKPSKKRRKNEKKRPIEMRHQQEVWHLAKPLSKKAIRINTKVLCVVPAIAAENDTKSSLAVDGEEQEQCFAGEITEIKDGHVRIHMEGLAKSEDLWMPAGSSKLFLDGGRWTEEEEVDGIPPLHYWEVMDSKHRCRDK